MLVRGRDDPVNIARRLLSAWVNERGGLDSLNQRSIYPLNPRYLEW
jgi:hypothetical protein